MITIANYQHLAIGVLAFTVGLLLDPTPPQSEVLALFAYAIAGAYVVLGIVRETKSVFKNTTQTEV